MRVGSYEISYDNSAVTHLFKTFWSAPTVENALLVGVMFKWLVYGIIIGIATAILTPFLVIYGLRVSSKDKR